MSNSIDYHKTWFENVINSTLKCTKYMKIYEDDKNTMYKRIDRYTWNVDDVKVPITNNEDYNSPHTMQICGTYAPYDSILVVKKQ